MGLDQAKLKRCGAKSKQTGKPCRAVAIRGKERCFSHGGRSTGARTASGKARAAAANYKHGRYTKEAIEDHLRSRTMLGWMDDLDEIAKG